MSMHTGDGKPLERRGFLKRSALMAAAAALAALPAAAQEPQAPAPAPQDEKKEEPPKKEEPGTPEKKVLRDKNGREYRVCDMCGANMYQEKNVWTCEQCGYSYEE